MLEQQEALAILELINRANISVKEAETVVAIKQKLTDIAKPKEDDKKGKE